MQEETYNYTDLNPTTIPVQIKFKSRDRTSLHLLLFLLTLISTLYAGAIMEVPNEDFGSLVEIYWYALTHLSLGMPFSFTLLAILGAHEMGHYILCRYHKMDATLPYFIPIPPLPGIPIGTLGAFIKIRSQIPDKKALFDVGIAGPLAGMLVAIPAMFLGLHFSEFHYSGTASGGFQLGEPLFSKIISYILFGKIPGNIEVMIGPMGLAAWLGFLITFLNLIPIGQLDGGHIAYALFGRHHAFIGKMMFVMLIVFGFVFKSFHWFFWAFVIFLLLGLKHPRPADVNEKLDFKRKCLSVIALIIFIGTFIHNPISIQQQDTISQKERLERSI